MNRDNSYSTQGLGLENPLQPSIPTFEHEWTIGEGIGAGLTRAAEIVIAATALVVFSPLMLLIALIVRWDSPGPALFRQRRLGANGREFWFYKFRTLYADAKERFPELYACTTIRMTRF